ncbi:MAG: type II toxin-antitoxin system RelE/ParE family toxin [Verrucomicrobia bacterium]|nr:type II toxin-antitoxin system RelE/ParE family toxin [Verrucomicrobiota bacterium]
MDFRVIDGPEAQRDLKEIRRYISLDSSQAAERFGRFLFSKTKMLARQPWMGRMVSDFCHPCVREIIVGNYRVIYEVNELEKRIEILRYWHGARGVPEI